MEVASSITIEKNNFHLTRMRALPFQTLAQLPCAFSLPASKRPNDVMDKHLHNRHPSITVKSLPRRVFLQLMGIGPMSLGINPVVAAPMQEMKEPEVIRVQDIEAFQWGENSSTVDQFSGESSPVTLPLDENQIIRGLKDVLTGMRVGGKRRALIPPSLGYINENLKPIPDEFGPRRSLLSHAKEPLIFEVQLLKIL
ncbi:FKBP-type peptidyl-prolyl cis-trans isomerase domain - like 10 [Theobroma cacao]|nr:FKBP-type peptidyl-prolyl cis-trans isomerase domain - like 10 [Theobroma cacao]